MLTQTVTITQNSTPNIIIGRRSTYETQQVIFDVSWLIQTYGEGTAELLIKRPKDASAYPVVAALDGNTLTWTVSDTDTQDKGHGECEIYWYVNGGLAKSCICGITILRDIGDTTETAPDPYETWVDELARLGAETLANAQAAEQSADSAAQSASEADNSAAAALESEENALNSENAAKASEQAAAASEQGAEQSATEAAQSASAAESSANDAQESADNASASADRAEQAAASIEGDTERAEAAAQTAQGAASDASRFAGTASTKATEAAGSAATAEQAASTATQKATDASASATSAAGSASSASASATAAGNAQTAAETAQGKAEDAQSAAETAAQSIEDSAAQIDTNTADILNLKSALDTKAGIIRDTASGSVASFVPDSTVPNLLGLSVALEPIQDLHGYDSPWPAGGGKNKIVYPYSDGSSKTINGVNFTVGSDGTVTANGTATANAEFFVAQGRYINFPAGTYTLSGLPSGASSTTFVYNSYAGSGIGGVGSDLWDFRVSSDRTITVESEIKRFTLAIRIISGYTANNLVFKPMFESGSSASPYSPYSNICPISGRESVEVEAAGVNLWDEQWESGDYTDADGQPHSQGTRIRTKNPIHCKPSTTYYFSLDGKRGQLFYYDRDDNFISTTSWIYYGQTFTTPSNCHLIRFYLVATAEYTEGVGINYPATDYAYHPFAGTTYTIQLGETVYGGTLDVTNGTLTVDRAMVDLGSLSWRYLAGDTVFYADIPDKQDGSANMRCSCYKTGGNTGYSTPDYTVGYSTVAYIVKRIFVGDPNYTSAADFSAAVTGQTLLYNLATPIEIQLDPVTISTISGQTNNVWADAGDVSVEFAADLKTYIDNKIAAAVAALS